MSDNYTEEIQPLYKLLKNDTAFRFVIVQHNHFSLVRRLQADLKQKFSTQKLTRLNAEKTTIQEILTTYDALGKGFLFLENFEDVLKESTDSLGKETPNFAKNNKRRQHITSGLNLRRDRLAKSPIVLILFISTTAGSLYAKTLMEKMPDLWSFRSWILALENTQLVQEATVSRAIETKEKQTSTLGGTDRTAKLAELNRLLTNLQEIDTKEIALRKTLYPQVIDLLKEVGQYQNALIYLEEWYVLEKEAKQAEILFDKGDIYRVVGNLPEAKKSFEELLIYYKEQVDDNQTSTCYQRLGDIEIDLGNLQKALTHFEASNNLEINLIEANPDNADFKNGLAISYEKLGETHASLGNLQKALQFFEDETELFQELYESYPHNVSFKDNLAISYSKLGETHASLGNLDKALLFFEKRSRLGKELYDSYPHNVSFKNGLAISYSKLGETHASLGNLDKALLFFEKDAQLTKELYDSYPHNVSFKNGLAISYYKMAQLYEKQEDLAKAFDYYQLDLKFTELTYQSSPNNAQYRKYLIISYNQMENISKKLGKDDLAKSYADKAKSLET